MMFTTSPQAMLEISNSSALSVPWLNITDGGNGTNFIIDTAGNVGIGTAAPESRFNIQSASTSSFPLIVNSSDGPALFSIQEGGGTAGFMNLYNGSGDLNIYLNTNGDSYLNSNTGNVGIGTTSPTGKLHVAGGAAVLDTGQQLQFDGLAGSAATSPYLYYSGGTGIILNTPTGNSTQFQVAQGTKMTIDSAGNVGIGTTSPDTKLHIDGTTSNSYLVLETDAGGSAGIFFRSDTLAQQFGIRTNANGLLFETGNNTASTTRMTMDSSGNVGIGTTTPANLLNVNGVGNFTSDLYVGGDNLTHPDYVFESYYNNWKGEIMPNYKMLTLEELEAYIKANSQLPPSVVQGAFALDTESNNIVKQQYYLLEKVEELTIYTIKQEARIEELEKKNKQQEARLQTLEQAQT